ncbi:MAG: 16S rRNA methyltransferase, partial [Desulfurococcales archaeon]|nr:16S rRNA methyltransferase [Desulfurococcales archaeon]
MVEGLGVKLILLESPLELVPKELWSHPQVVRTSRRYGVGPGEIILDKSLHYNAMEPLPQKWKRGRPDIVHTTLLVIQDTILPRGMVDVYIHVYDGRVYRLHPDVRLPKHLDRFKGLMAQLLRHDRVPLEGDPLIWLSHKSLREFAAEHRIILMWERGRRVTPGYVAVRALTTGAAIGIGMFPRGDFKKSTLRKAWERYSIAGGAPLKAWAVSYTHL